MEASMRRRATKGRTRITRLTTVALGLGLAASVAWGGEQLGTVKSVDQGQKAVLLSDGTQLWLVPGLSTDLFVQGKRVKIVYDDRDGKRWVRGVEATN
jgi:hypothetical protein